MGAFFAASSVEPKLAPPPNKQKKYKPMKGGMKIEARYVNPRIWCPWLALKAWSRNLSFTYPGSKKKTLHNVNLVVEPGETLAIVGYNGSGNLSMNGGVQGKKLKKVF